ncbi:hypothetical protein E2320_007308 [Naja naja]|nr:hypothetical protein E2320_007308 [Naja naja]
MMPTPVILLKEGTDTSQGIPQLVSNITACQSWQLSIFAGKATISNDGATILKLLDVVHPAAKTLVDIAKELRGLLEKCASTALSSKLISHQKDFFAKMVVDAVMMLDELLQIKMIGIKKDSQLVAGVAFKKTFSYAGFEMQPKKYESPKIALLNIDLLPLVPQDYQAIVDAEWNILYDKLDKLHKSGAKVILSKLPIGDVATQYFADRDMFCAGRACGGSIQTSANALTDDVLGRCDLFEEAQIGGERYNFFTGCPKAKTCTIILRGGAEQFMEETERSLHDAIMIVRRAIKHDSVVAGGGAIEMEISKYLRDYSRTIPGKQQLLIGAYAKALEIIPRQLCDNAGFDATNILNQLRAKHAQVSVLEGEMACEPFAKTFFKKNPFGLFLSF